MPVLFQIYLISAHKMALPNMIMSDLWVVPKSHSKEDTMPGHITVTLIFVVLHLKFLRFLS